MMEQLDRILAVKLHLTVFQAIGAAVLVSILDDVIRSLVRRWRRKR